MNIHDHPYWETPEGLLLKDLRKLIEFLSLISIEGMPTPFIIPLHNKEEDKWIGYTLSWEETSELYGSLHVEICNPEFIVYAWDSNTNDYVFWYEIKDTAEVAEAAQSTKKWIKSYLEKITQST